VIAVNQVGDRGRTSLTYLIASRFVAQNSIILTCRALFVIEKSTIGIHVFPGWHTHGLQYVVSVSPPGNRRNIVADHETAAWVVPGLQENNESAMA
jgi:hypothetical protein